MKSKIYLLIFIYLIKTTNVFSQDTSALGSHPKYLLVNFGGLTKGEIVMNDHLADSLAFTITNEPLDMTNRFNSSKHITAFNLTLKCNGQVLGYYENKSGNKLTTKMQDAVRKLHPGCSIIFDAIQASSTSKDRNGNYSHFPMGKSRLELILK